MTRGVGGGGGGRGRGRGGRGRGGRGGASVGVTLKKNVKIYPPDGVLIKKKEGGRGN